MLYIYPTPKYPRTPLEATMKTVYGLTNALTGIALVVTMTEYFIFLKNCMPEYYTNGQLVLSDSLEYVLDGCAYTGTVHLMNVKAEIVASKESITMGLMQCAQFVTALFSLLFVTMVINGVSMMLYRAGDRHIRLFGVHISIYHAMVALSYVINFATIAATFSYDTQRLFYKDAVSHCAEQAKNRDLDAFYKSEYTGFTIFSVAVYWPLSAACANLLIFMTGLVVRCVHSNHRADILLSEADAPWERRGFSCSTSKPLLRLHTAQRTAIVEEAEAAMKQGMAVRIVRSYQLLTEEDYAELVQAMRQQVEEAIKEEQFEILRRNCGEDEAAWDQTGFMWHDRLPWALPTPLDSEIEEREEVQSGASTNLSSADLHMGDGAEQWSPSEEGPGHYHHPDTLGEGFAGGPEPLSEEMEMGWDPAAEHAPPVRRRRRRRVHRPAPMGAEPLDAADEADLAPPGDGDVRRGGGRTLRLRLTAAVYSPALPGVLHANGVPPLTRRKRSNNRMTIPICYYWLAYYLKSPHHPSFALSRCPAPELYPPLLPTLLLSPPPPSPSRYCVVGPAFFLQLQLGPSSLSSIRMKASLIECFPDPLTPQWPATANQVTCEARQIYALAAIACCVPGAHVLVLHDQEEPSSHLRSCMTRGFRYVDFTITPATTATQLAGFLAHSEQDPRPGSGAAREKDADRLQRDSSTVSDTFSIQDCVVACIRGAHHASPGVLSTLMDAVSVGQVRYAGKDSGGATRGIPSVHVLLFCREKGYAEMLPESFRAGFALSTYVSSLTMDRAPVLRSNNMRNSSIINKRNLIDVMANGASLDTVSLSGEVSAYLRHLLLVLRGSLLPGTTAGTYAVRQISMHRRILCAAAVLFQPPPEALAIRPLQDVGAPSRRPSTGAVTTNNSLVGSSAGATDFSHVIVSPSDVLCMLCPMVAHVFTITRNQIRSLTATTTIHQRQDSSSSAANSAGVPAHRGLSRGFPAIISATDDAPDGPAPPSAIHALPEHGGSIMEAQAFIRPSTFHAGGGPSIHSVRHRETFNDERLADCVSRLPDETSDSGLRRNHFVVVLRQLIYLKRLRSLLLLPISHISASIVLLSSLRPPVADRFHSSSPSLFNRELAPLCPALQSGSHRRQCFICFCLAGAAFPLPSYMTRRTTTTVSYREAVKGYDRTQIPRVSYEDYLAELRDESKTSTQNPSRGSLLSSTNPNIQFSSKYPVYNRLGHELCVLYQAQDVDVSNELRRVVITENGRRSGVRLSTEVPLRDGDKDGMAELAGRGRSADEDARWMASVEQWRDSRRRSYSSRATASLQPSQCSTRPSVFSIYRESGARATVSTREAEPTAKRRRTSASPLPLPRSATRCSLTPSPPPAQARSTTPRPVPATASPPLPACRPSAVPPYTTHLIVPVDYGTRATAVPLSAVATTIERNLTEQCEKLLAGDVLAPQDGVADVPWEPGARLRLGTDLYEIHRCVPGTDVFQACVGEEEALLYRWRRGELCEARRAALGLLCCAPGLRVRGTTVEGSGGITAIRLPVGYRAVPLGQLTISNPGAYASCARLLLRMLSSLLSRRIVHGGLEGLDNVWVACGPGSPAEAAPPILFPLHWERCVDFNMFADRSVGRSVALQLDDEVPSVAGVGFLHGTDLRLVLHELLEMRASRTLSSDVYCAAQQLVLLATAPTQASSQLVLQRSSRQRTRQRLNVPPLSRRRPPALHDTAPILITITISTRCGPGPTSTFSLRCKARTQTTQGKKVLKQTKCSALAFHTTNTNPRQLPTKNSGAAPGLFFVLLLALLISCLLAASVSFFSSSCRCFRLPPGSRRGSQIVHQYFYDQQALPLRHYSVHVRHSGKANRLSRGLISAHVLLFSFSSV
eukprot:gene5217-3735_t